MAKKHGFLKLLVIGAAAAGTYYYLKKKNSGIPTNMEDDEDFDNFDEDVDDGPASKGASKRSYVSLDFDTVSEKAKDAANKFAEAADKAAGVIGEKLGKAAGKVEEFFDDRKPVPDVDIEIDLNDSDNFEASEDDYVEDNE